MSSFVPANGISSLTFKFSPPAVISRTKKRNSSLLFFSQKFTENIFVDKSFLGPKYSRFIYKTCVCRYCSGKCTSIEHCIQWSLAHRVNEHLLRITSSKIFRFFHKIIIRFSYLTSKVYLHIGISRNCLTQLIISGWASTVTIKHDLRYLLQRTRFGKINEYLCTDLFTTAVQIEHISVLN